MSTNMKPMSRTAVAQLLRGHGITPTHQRMQIASVLFAKPQHLSAEQVLAAVNARHAATSKATVYNTLKLLVERKLVREVIVDPNKVFYDPNVQHHHHLYEVETGHLIDIDADAVQVVGLPPLPEGTVAEGIDVIVRIRRNAGL
jgi:Fur family transcriptional regulator, iron response regulator